MARYIDEIQAQQTMERWRASGLGVAQFAKREGISVGTFYRRRAKADAAAGEPVLVAGCGGGPADDGSGEHGAGLVLGG